MTKSIIFKNTAVKNQTRGRKTSDKTAKVRRAVLRTLEKAKAEGQTLSTKDIAKMSKQNKVAVGIALRWAEQNELVSRVGEVKHEGRGRPMSTWCI